MKNLGLALLLSFTALAPQAHAQVRINSVYRWQTIKPLLNDCSAAVPDVLADQTQNFIGFWGSNLVSGQTFLGQPAIWTTTRGTVFGAVDNNTDPRSDAIYGSTTAFSTFTAYARGSISATSNNTCSANQFAEATTGMRIEFSLNRTETFGLYGTVTSQLTWAPLATVNARLECNGQVVFAEASIAGFETYVTVPNGSSCVYNFSAKVQAEGGFSDNNLLRYEVFFKSNP
ncbi:MAG: hypothetical protein SFW67_09500 [Myxococcaceae bacterium]|nr:hypothetical protein [Myxococcaceae bacterium]